MKFFKLSIVSAFLIALVISLSTGQDAHALNSKISGRSGYWCINGSVLQPCDTSLSVSLPLGGTLSGDLDFNGSSILNALNIRVDEQASCDSLSGVAGHGQICYDTDGSFYGIDSSGTATAFGGLTIGGSATDNSVITADGTGGNVQYRSNVTVNDNGEYSANVDTDRSNVFGRVRLSSPVADSAYFGHYDRSASSDMALAQLSSGITILNAPAGASVRMAINGSSEILMNATNFYPVANGGMALGLEGSNGFDGLYIATGFIVPSGTAGITASTTQTQGQGALTTEVNEVSTVANANDTVTAPTASAFRRLEIINNGANTLQVFPASGDNLGAGVNNAISISAGSNAVFRAYDATNWEQII